MARPVRRQRGHRPPYLSNMYGTSLLLLFFPPRRSAYLLSLACVYSGSGSLAPSSTPSTFHYSSRSPKALPPISLPSNNLMSTTFPPITPTTATHDMSALRPPSDASVSGGSACGSVVCMPVQRGFARATVKPVRTTPTFVRDKMLGNSRGPCLQF